MRFPGPMPYPIHRTCRSPPFCQSPQRGGLVVGAAHAVPPSPLAEGAWWNGRDRPFQGASPRQGGRHSLGGSNPQVLPVATARRSLRGLGIGAWRVGGGGPPHPQSSSLISRLEMRPSSGAEPGTGDGDPRTHQLARCDGPGYRRAREPCSPRARTSHRRRDAASTLGRVLPGVWARADGGAIREQRHFLHAALRVRRWLGRWCRRRVPGWQWSRDRGRGCGVGGRGGRVAHW